MDLIIKICEDMVYYIKKIGLQKELLESKRNDVFYDYIIKREEARSCGDAASQLRLMNKLPTFLELDSFKDLLKKDINDASKILEDTDKLKMSDTEIYRLWFELNNAISNANRAISDYEDKKLFIIQGLVR